MNKIYAKFLLCLICVSLAACKAKTLTLNGYVEAEYRNIAATSPGILKKLYVQKGDFVKKGTELFELEDTELRVSIENAKTEIHAAGAGLKEAEHEYSRAKILLKKQAISLSEYDKKEAAYSTSEAKLEIAKQQLIAAKKKLADSAPSALSDVQVADTFFMPGEFVPAGRPVVSLLVSTDVKVRFFVPQRVLPIIRMSQTVWIRCDGCKGQIPAKITYIAKQAEFTPPVIYSVNSREKMVFMIEAKPDIAQCSLCPGLPVDVSVEARS